MLSNLKEMYIVEMEVTCKTVHSQDCCKLPCFLQKHKTTGIKIFICTGSLRILCIYFHHINSSVINSSKIYILLFFSSTFVSCPTPIKQFMLLNMLGCLTFHLAMVELPGTTFRKKTDPSFPAANNLQ